MGKVVVFIGPECSGKSFLAKEMGNKLGIPFSKEYARAYAEEIDRALESNDAEKILQGQTALENDFFQKHKNESTLVLDTNLLSSIIYGKWYFNLDFPDWEEQIKDRRYDQYLLFFPDIPWVKDKARGEDNRVEMFQFFKDEMDKRNIEYSIIKGDMETRLEKVIGLLNGEIKAL